MCQHRKDSTEMLLYTDKCSYTICRVASKDHYSFTVRVVTVPIYMNCNHSLLRVEMLLK